MTEIDSSENLSNNISLLMMKMLIKFQNMKL